MVTSFNEKRGVGYISCTDDLSNSVYVVKQPDIDLPGYAVLESGQLVDFDVVDVTPGQNSDAPTAQNVRPKTA